MSGAAGWSPSGGGLVEATWHEQTGKNSIAWLSHKLWARCTARVFLAFGMLVLQLVAAGVLLYV